MGKKVRGKSDPERGQRLEEALRIRNVKKMYVLAIELGVNESAISRWRKGQPITMDNAINLCRALDVSADWLILGRGNVDQHNGFCATVEERKLLRLIRSLPSGFMTHFSRAIDALDTQ